MSHEIDMSNARANMAYVGETPWHGLGFQIDANASAEEWRKAAGLDWSIQKAVISATTEDGTEIDCGKLNRSVLYRDDTMAPLSIMSDSSYKVVQPNTILQFIGDSANAMGWKMETAGSLNGGKKIWALANIGAQEEVMNGDMVKGYLLAATACDGTMASQFMFTSVRVVCSNTLGFAVDSAERDAMKGKSGQPRVSVFHSSVVDVDKVRQQLGIAGTSWGRFIENAKRLARTSLTVSKANEILRKVYEKDDAIEGEFQRVADAKFVADHRAAKNVLDLYMGGGIGSHLKSAQNTAWGLVNATTEFYDHQSNSRNDNNRLNSAWFGRGAKVKQAVVDACMELVD